MQRRKRTTAKTRLESVVKRILDESEWLRDNIHDAPVEEGLDAISIIHKNAQEAWQLIRNGKRGR